MKTSWAMGRSAIASESVRILSRRSGMSAAAKKPFVLEDALIEAWATHAEITRYLLENLDEKAWSAEPPGGGRTVAAIVAHVHNVRRMMLVMHAKGTRIA